MMIPMLARTSYAPFTLVPAWPRNTNKMPQTICTSSEHKASPSADEAFKGRRKKAIEPGNEGQPCPGSKKPAGSAEVADGDQDRGDGNHAEPADAKGRLRYGLHEPLQVVHFTAGQGQQDDHGPADIAKCNDQPGEEDGARYRAAGIFNFIGHEPRPVSQPPKA